MVAVWKPYLSPGGPTECNAGGRIFLTRMAGALNPFQEPIGRLGERAGSPTRCDSLYTRVTLKEGSYLSFEGGSQVNQQSGLAGFPPLTVACFLAAPTPVIRTLLKHGAAANPRPGRVGCIHPLASVAYRATMKLGLEICLALLAFVAPPTQAKCC